MRYLLIAILLLGIVAGCSEQNPEVIDLYGCQEKIDSMLNNKGFQKEYCGSIGENSSVSVVLKLSNGESIS